MVKMKFGRLLTIGLIPEELEILKAGHPLHCDMADVGDRGHIILLVGDSNEKLKNIAEQTAAQLEKGKQTKQLVLPNSVKLQ